MSVPLRVPAVAKALGVHQETVRLWCRTGKIVASLTPGGMWLIAPDTLAKFLPDGSDELETARQRAERVKAGRAKLATL